MQVKMISLVTEVNSEKIVKSTLDYDAIPQTYANLT